MPSCPVLLLASLLALTVPAPEERIFSQKGEEIDNFLIRTVQRVSESWSLCQEEFRLSSESAVEESKDYVKKEVKRQTESAVEALKEKAAESWKDQRENKD